MKKIFSILLLIILFFIVGCQKDVYYSASFYNYDGTLLLTEKFKENDIIVYHGEVPEKPGNDKVKEYKFIGWDKELTYIKENISFTAIFEEVLNEYIVEFYNEYGGELLFTDIVSYGETAVYEGPEVTIELAPGVKKYEFIGWDSDLNNITSDLRVHALFEITEWETFNIIFKNYDGSIILCDTVKYGDKYNYNGEIPIKPGDEVVEKYKFIGWNIDLNELSIYEDLELTAQYEIESLKSYTVTFKNYDGEVLYIDTVYYGDEAEFEGTNPSRPNDNNGNEYSFIGWDKELKNVTNDLIVTAQYSQKKLEYTVLFENYDGSLLQSIRVKHGENANYTLNTPTRPNDEKYQYLFIGWDKSFNNIIADSVFTAQYSRQEIEYTVTFLDFKDEVILTKKVKYGQSVSYTGEIPSKPADNIAEVYEFENWDNDFSFIENDLIIKPVFKIIKLWDYQFEIDYSTQTFSIISYTGTEENLVLPVTFTIKDKIYIVNKIGFRAFSNNNDILTVKIPKEVEIIDNEAFSFCKNMINVIIEDNSRLTNINYAAFAYCYLLSEFSIPDSVEHLGESAFRSCEALEVIYISTSSKINNIYETTFYNCESLKSIFIPKEVLSIGDSAFTNCYKMTEVIFDREAKIQTIERYAFSSCAALDNLFIPKSVTTFLKDAFNGTAGLTIYCEVESKPDGWYDNWSGYFSDVVWNVSYDEFYK